MPTDEENLRSYLEAVGRIPLLSVDEESDLWQDFASGDERQQLTARKRLIESQLGLVVSIATRYKGSALPLIDLLQEGNIGLTRAVERFDRSSKYRFSTYASWRIRQAIIRAVAERGGSPGSDEL
ncbi:MAG TPA: sigma-70 family RNA polymerase sigma factor [Actinomycetota bacterium]